MLDMGFLPDIRRVLRHLPDEAADALLLGHDAAADRGSWRARCCKNPVTINLERKAAPGRRHHAGGLPGGAGAEGARCSSSSSSAATSRACSSSRARSTAPTGWPRCSIEERRRLRAHPRQPLARRSARRRSPASRRASSACSSRPTSPRAASTSRRSRTSSTSTCPTCPRTTSTASAAPPAPRRPATRSRSSRPTRRRTCARSSGRSASGCPRITVPGFDYAKAPAERFEVPIGERIAPIRARKAEERSAAKEKAERRRAHESPSVPAAQRPAAAGLPAPARAPTGRPDPGHRPCAAGSRDLSRARGSAASRPPATGSPARSASATFPAAL